MVGKLIAGRYEVQERIGTGGMSLVYRARDLVLHRNVAVKILKHQWAEDEDVVRRFEQEARAAASLSNEHIVRVFDVGREPPDYHYMIMELVPGETLRAKLDREGPLSVAQTLAIAEQVTEALEAAHNERLIHRDIKPQNILITQNGAIKVTDFGIAYAATSGTLVNTGSLLGTVQYLSPEQARGKLIGVQSDIYSLGVVLFEMLTGRLPFEGESAIGVAIKHLQDEAPEVRSLRPDVNESTNHIVRRALAKDPADRYQSARAMRQDIVRAIQGEPLAPWADRDARPAAIEANQEEAPQKKRRRPWLPWVIALVIVLGAIGGAVYAFERWFNVPTVSVPDVRGESLSQAQATLSRVGLLANVVGHAPSNKVAKNKVLNENPSPSTPVKQGRAVNLVLSSGPTTIKVRNVVGQDVDQASIELTSAGFTVKTQTVTSSKAAGTVLSQNPQAGQTVATGSTVVLQVAKGPPQTAVVIPNLTGLTVSAAASQLVPLNVSMGTPTLQYSTQAQNTIIDQNPEPYAALGSGSVSATVSNGISPQSRKAVRNSSTADWQVPGSAAPKSLVKMVVTDNEGNEEVSYQQVNPGQTISFPFVWYGTSGQLLVYMNGTLESTTPLTPTNAAPSSTTSSPSPQSSAPPSSSPSKSTPPPTSSTPAPPGRGGH